MARVLQISTLGGVHLRLDGEPFDALRSRKVTALLIFLAYQRGPVPREMLADLLWTNSTPDRAQANLRVALHDLRKHLQPFVRIERANAAINQEAQVRLDAHDLLNELGADDSGRVRAALAGYAGDFLAGFFVRDAPAFDDWAAAQRERLHQQVLDAYRRAALEDQQQQAFKRGQATVRQWLALDPLAEDGHRLLMQMLAASGRQADALAQADAARDILARELGVPLDPATVELAAQIAAGQWSPLLPAPRPFPAADLPAEQTPFFGRQQELTYTADRLSDDGVRLITLVGPGGIGKTRLALAAARRQDQSGAFDHGVRFVSLADLDEASQLPRRLASGLGLNAAPDGDVQAQVRRFLRGRRLLLVLDNLEQIEDAADYLADLLRSAPGLTLLITSRERLWLQAEHVLRLDGLSYDDDDSEAARLFVAVAQRARHDFELTSDNRAAVVALCRLVEGLPLALELAAGRVVDAPVAAILAEISARHDQLQTRLRDVPSRHQSMLAVFESTWARLDESERAFVAAFSVFRGGADQRAVLAVSGVETAVLDALVHKSVLQYDERSERYFLHELLRQFAAEQLELDGEAAQRVRRAHSGTYLARLAAGAPDLRGPQQDKALDEIEVDAANIRLAWRAAAEQAEPDLPDEAVDALGFFYLWRNHYDDGLDAFSAAAAAGEQASPETTAHLLTWQAVFLQRRGDRQTAEGLLRRSLTLLADGAPAGARRDRLEARAHLRLAQALAEDGRLPSAQQEAEAALALAQDLDDNWAQAAALFTLGDVANSGGLYPAALSHFEAALARFEVLGDRRAAARVLQRMSYAARDLGRMAQSQQYAEQALAVLEGSQDREQLAQAHLALGWLHLYQGRLEPALASLEQSVALFDELGLPAPLNVLGITHQELGNYEEARRLLTKQIAADRAAADRVDLAFTLVALSVLEIIEGNYETALLLQEESVSLHSGGEQRDRRAQAPSVMGYALRALGDRSGAREQFRQAIEMSLAIDSIIPLLFAVPGMALLLADDGRVNEALRLYAPLARLPMVANSTMRADLAGKELARLSGVPLAKLGAVEGTAEMSPWDAAREALAAE